MNKDIYLLAEQIQNLCGMDQYKDPPGYSGTTSAIVSILREYLEDK